jgi:hypothetical protein
VVPQPIPVETPVTATSLPFVIASLLFNDHCSSALLAVQ